MSEIFQIEQHLKLLKSEIEYQEAILRLTGQDFNVFEILKLDTSEVRTHSAFITELLNPTGSHGQQDTFLNLFIDVLLKAEKNNDESNQVKTNKLSQLRHIVDADPNFKHAIITAEKHIGKKNSEDVNEASGRMDIVIDAGHYKIIIENKIYADLGDNQIYNYCKWAEDENGLGVVFYLALNDTDTTEKLNESGKSPNGGWNYKLNEDFFRITYDSQIIQWLEKCKKEVSSLPLIRETITQYINLIKKLTNKSMYNPRIIDLIKKDPAIAQTIKSSYECLTNYLIDLKGKIKDSIMEKYSGSEEIEKNRIKLYEMEGIITCFGQDEDGIWIGYKLKSNESIENLKRYQKKFKELNIKYSSNNVRWIGWFNPIPEKIPMRKSNEEGYDEKMILAFSDQEFSYSIDAICKKEEEVSKLFFLEINKSSS